MAAKLFYDYPSRPRARRFRIIKMPSKGNALVNVLKPEAFEREHIPGSINIREGDESVFANPGFPKTRRYRVLRLNGLTKRGFTQGYDYAAGLRDWKQGGIPWKRMCIEAETYSFSYQARRIERCTCLGRAHTDKPCKARNPTPLNHLTARYSTHQSENSTPG